MEDKKSKKNKGKPTPKEKEEPSVEDDDFGGFPKEVDFRRNLGCGG